MGFYSWPRCQFLEPWALAGALILLIRSLVPLAQWHNVFRMRLFFLFFFFLLFGCLSLWFLGPRILLWFVSLHFVPSYFLCCAWLNQIVRPLTLLRGSLSLLVVLMWKLPLLPSSSFSSFLAWIFFVSSFPILQFGSLFFAFSYIWARGTLPRLRYDSLIFLCWKSLLPLSLCYLLLSLLLYSSTFALKAYFP